MNSIEDVILKSPFAHRGLHDNNKEIPENSILSFQNAIDKNYAIELDVHLLTDGSIAVFHDESLLRLCNIDAKIYNLDSKQIKHHKLANTNQTIPLLIEVLELVKGRVPLLIEIKRSIKIGEIEKKVAEILLKYNGPYAVQSFNPLSLAWFSKKHPNILRGQLSGSFKNENISFLKKWILRNFLLNWKSRPHFIGYDQMDILNPKLQRLRNKGMPVLSWTLRNELDQKRVIKFCDNIIFENYTPSKF